jgi:CHAD domain-containing protein
MKKPQAVRWDPSKSTVESARTTIPQLAQRLFTAGRKAAKRKIKTKTLHEFRLEVKRFRYTLELFRPLYGPALDTRLAKLRRMQQYLGAINDCTTTRALIVGAQGKASLLVKELLSRLDTGEKDSARKFVRYWTETFDAPGEQERLVRYLRNYAGRGGRLDVTSGA